MMGASEAEGKITSGEKQGNDQGMVGNLRELVGNFSTC